MDVQQSRVVLMANTEVVLTTKEPMTNLTAMSAGEEPPVASRKRTVFAAALSTQNLGHRSFSLCSVVPVAESNRDPTQAPETVLAVLGSARRVDGASGFQVPALAF